LPKWDSKADEDGDGAGESSLAKLGLLIWKNWRIQLAHKIETVLQILFPILFTLILVSVRVIIEAKEVSNATIFPAFDINVLPNTPSLCW
jgi:hypothetical protein